MKAPSAPHPWPTWAPARKDMIGASLGSSRLWFTVAEGIVTEVYYPRVDIPQIKDLGFIIADGNGFWIELRTLRGYAVKTPSPGVPAVEIIHRHERFTFTQRICPSQVRDALLIQFKLEGDPSLRPYALLAARLGGNAEDDCAWAERHNGHKILWAEQGPFGLALSVITPDGEVGWQRCSVGCSEASDGWQDFHRNGRMTWEYDSAGPGPVALTGELPQTGTLALGFGESKQSAATLALSSLVEDFAHQWDQQCEAWSSWLGKGSRPKIRDDIDRVLELSATVLKVHQDRTYRGAVVASLSAPWGQASQSRGGYHLVWARDLVETAGALIAMNELSDARDVLRYLIATQQDNGHWFQNQWLGGTPFWQGIQLDESAFPILLAALLKDRDALDAVPIADMVKRAAGFIVREGPATGQDRWEEDAGVNTFTLSVAIAALVEAAVFLDEPAKGFVLKLADYWNARLEDWTFVTDTPLSRAHGVGGYYVRTVPLDCLTRNNARSEIVEIKNLAHDPDLPANAQIATDFLQLVRYGLRSANDLCITDTVKLVDALLKCETPNGPAWHRYNDDGYGEHNDGSPFDGTGHGRGWPLLVGERGHYALSAGEDPMPYLDAMLKMASPLGLIPEQVWDTAAIPDRDLFPGKPSGSAMPLVWAHGEFIKLCYSRALGSPVDRPSATWARYRGRRPKLDYDIWSATVRLRQIPSGNTLMLMLREPALVHWGIDGWQNVADVETQDTGLGVHVAELQTKTLKPGQTIQFTFYWKDRQAWEGENYNVMVTERTTP